LPGYCQALSFSGEGTPSAHVTLSPNPFPRGRGLIWTRSTHLYQHDATNNAEKPEKCVVRCHDCNEQRGNSPKPCCSLHAFPLYGAGFTLTWRRFPLPWRRFHPPMAQVSTPLPWRIVPLHIIGHFCGLRRSADRGITHFRPKTRNGTFLTPAATVYVQLKCRQRAISCTYTS